MSKFIDGLALPFAWFADGSEPRWTISASMSFVNPQNRYSIKLTGKVASEVPEMLRSQRFDENYLLPISEVLGVDLLHTAILIAIRNAWIAYFLETEIFKTSVDDIRLLMTNEIAIEYVVLTSSKWVEHPWIQEQIYRSQKYNDNPSGVRHLDEPIEANYHQAMIEKQENDINFQITRIKRMRGAYTVNVQMEDDADNAGLDIKHAKKRIKELHSEVEQQEAIIRAAMKPILNLKKYERSLKLRSPGRPEISEAKQQRRDIATKFVEKWIRSAMEELSIKTCGGLAKLLGGQKMTWGRWLKQETLPPSRYLERLLEVEVKSGVNKNTKLRNLQTVPMLTDLIALVDLV